MQKERKMVYQIERFVRTYTNGMKKEELFEQDFGSDSGKLLLTTKSEQEATAYFETIKAESKQLRNYEYFNFYYFDKVTYDEDGEVVEVEGIDFKKDEIEK